MKHFQQHAAMMLLIRPEDGQIVDANPAAVRFYGYSYQGLCSLPIHAINQRPPHEVTQLIRTAALLESSHFVFPHRLADGSLRTVEVTAGPVEIEGSVYLLSIVHDISDRVRAERGLRESEERFSKAFHGSPDSININRYEDGLYLEVNEGFTRITGYTEADVVGRSSLPGDLGIWVDRADRDRMVAGLAASGAVDLEAHFRRKDGSILLGAMSARLIELDGVKCVLTITRDLTERRRMEAAALTEDKLASLSLLAGGIAHDFNNLLAGVLGNISLARAAVKGAAEAEEFLRSAERASLRARDLTRQLLTFARGGAPVKRLANLGSLIQEAALFAAHGSNCECTVSVAPDLWPAEVDEGQLGQVVQNIVINGVQAMPGGGTITVDAVNEECPAGNRYAVAGGPYVRVSISDQGPGIAAEMQKRIFDPYFTTKKAGSGLGLATSYSIVRNHGGYLGLGSAPGKGATFTVLLPASPGRAAPAVARPAPEVMARGRRVLVMDDQEMVRTMVERMLRSLGFDVQCAAHGEQALALFQAARDQGAPFQIAIIDLTVVGGMGGKETLAGLLSLDPMVKVVVSSGYSDELNMADFARHGARAVLPKPYRLQDLKAVLAALSL